MGTLPVLLLLVGSASLSAPAGRAVRRSAPHAPAPRDPVAVAIKSELEADALLLTEPALAAFVEAEVRAFLDARAPDESGACAALARAARDAYVAASREEGLLSNHGSLLSFVRTELSAPSLAEPLRRAACAPFDVSRHTVDMLHHRLFRGAPTKTASPTGSGDVAARDAVGLPPAPEAGDEDCLVEPPPALPDGDCLWDTADEREWQRRRFERVQMEGWRDPRRGNSGTSR